MTETTTIDPIDVICGLKGAVQALECHHNMHLFKQKMQQPPAPVYIMIPIDKGDNKDPHIHRKKHIKHAGTGRKSERCNKKSKLSDLKFPEMRGGVLYDKCMCLHRNGLQDTCPLTQCQGQPKCRVKPWPVCPPGKFVRSRYPQQFPMPL